MRRSPGTRSGPPAGGLSLLLCLAPALAGAVTFSHDFNAVQLPRVTDQVHPYPGWSVEVDGRVWYDVGFATDGPDSSVALVLRASTVDPGLTDAAVRLRLDLGSVGGDIRFLVEEDAVLQWDWWIRDNRLSEAVGVRLVYRRGDRRETREHWNTPFYSPSDGFAPVLVWDCHRMDLADLHTPCTGPDAECVVLEAVEFELRGPVTQELRIDNLYLGPRAGVSDCSEARTPGFLIMKLQSFSATQADLDLDGRWDVLLPGFLGRTAQLWRGRDRELADAAPAFGLDRYLGDVALFLDVDNDGDQDLVTAYVERKGLDVYENLGRGRLATAARTYPTNVLPLSVATLTAADVDGDGWLDVYLAAHDAADVLMLNDGRGGFRQAAPDVAAPLRQPRISTGALFADLDDDRDPDLLVSGSGLHLNAGGRFVPAEPALVGGDRSMVEGVTVADLDGDGRWDVYLGVDQDSCLRPFTGRNLLFWGAPNGSLVRDRRSQGMVADPGHCEGVAAADFDHDGTVDLFIGNRSGPSLCLLGEGGGEFRADRSEVFGSLEIPDLYGLVAGDRDDDGDQDVLILRKHNDPIWLLNPTDDDRFVKVRLLGIASNWDAIGAQARLTRSDTVDSGFVAIRELRAGSGYQLSGPRELHFGLPGPGTYRLEVAFPSGLTVVREGVRPGARLVVAETRSAVVAAWHRGRRHMLPAVATRLAAWPLPLQHVMLGALAAAAAVAWAPRLRRVRLGLELRRALASGPGLGLLALLALLVTHHLGWHGDQAWGLAVSLPVGVVAGAWLPVGWRYLRRRQTPLAVWDRLNEEFVSYTHTGWCKNLETLIRQGGMLAGDLDPADREALLERWLAAHAQFYGAVLPKLTDIAELGALLEETRPAARDLATGLRRMVRARRDAPQDLAAGARELRQTADRLAALVEARLSCRVDTALRTAWRALLPDLEAHGVRGVCDAGEVAGIRVRIREHELVMVLQDVLRNAIEAAAGRARSGGEVRVSATADLRKATVEVHDTGPGLGGRDPEQLCQPGFTTKDRGSGYGLAHARRTLGAYRGTLALADGPQGGMLVTIGLLRPLHVRGDGQGGSPS